MWRMDTLRWGTGLLLAEVGQTPQEKLRAPHSPWRRSALPCAHTAARSHSTETTDHFPPKQPVTLLRFDRSLSSEMTGHFRRRTQSDEASAVFIQLAMTAATAVSLPR